MISFGSIKWSLRDKEIYRWGRPQGQGYYVILRRWNHWKSGAFILPELPSCLCSLAWLIIKRLTVLKCVTWSVHFNSTLIHKGNACCPWCVLPLEPPCCFWKSHIVTLPSEASVLWLMFNGCSCRRINQCQPEKVRGKEIWEKNKHEAVKWGYFYGDSNS